MTAKFETVGTYVPDNLIAGDFPQNFEKVVVKLGENLPRGALLGKITAGGKHVLSDAAATDGSQTPRAILVEAVDATAADTEGMVYLSGTFDARSITFGDGHDADSVKDDLRGKGIWLVNTTA